MICSTAEGGDDDDVLEPESVKREFQSLVEVGAVLVLEENQAILAKPGPGPTADGVEIADHLTRAQPQPCEVIGTAVRCEESRRLGCQSGQSRVPYKGRVGYQNSVSLCHTLMVQEPEIGRHQAQY